jgi:hypothetical protein
MLRGILEKLLIFCLLNTLLLSPAAALEYRHQLIDVEGISQRVVVPDGYLLELLTASLDGPRMLTFTENGDLFIGSRSGKVYRLTPPYTKPEVLITLPDYPHSVALRRG